MGRIGALAIVLAVGGPAFAQDPRPSPGAPPAAGLRAGAIAASGQTVPNPQAIPAAPRTAVDRPIDGQIRGRTDFGICKGC